MDTAELNRLIANIVRTGKILEVQAGLVRVEFSKELQTDWLQYFVPFAGGVSVHRMPSVGESCVVLAPSGDLEAAMVLCGIASTAHPSPSQSKDETVVRFPDGASVKYNHVASHLEITGIKTAVVNAGQSTEINCPKNTINGPTTINGLLTCTQGMTISGGTGATATFTGNVQHIGKYDNTGSITSNGVDLHTHTHSGVMTGGSNTGKPS